VELFVNLYYAVSMVLFCAGIIGFILWENISPSPWVRWKVAAEDHPAPARSRQDASAAMKLEEVPSF
jgi:hypothetical protein